MLRDTPKLRYFFGDWESNFTHYRYNSDYKWGEYQLKLLIHIILFQTSKLDPHLLSFKITFNKLPIDQTTESLDILCPCVSIIYVIGMLPDINSQNGLISASHWIFSIRSVNDEKFFILFSQPSPTRSKVSYCLSRKLFQKIINCIPFQLYLFQKLSLWLWFVWRDAWPEKGMIPVLQSVVKDLLISASMSYYSYLVIISSNGLFCHYVPEIRLFKLVM